MMNTKHQSFMMHAILNKKHALSSLTDAEFEAILPQLAAELAANGVLRETYTDTDILKDWALLKKKDTSIHAMTISATEVAGMKVMRKHMQHFHAVRNYKGHSVESLWTQPCLEKALRFNRAQHSTPYASEIIRSPSFANGLGKVTMYRPLMAKKVVSYLTAKDGLTEVRVLDVCAGWGGRMIGAKSAELSPGSKIKVHYTGIDPCEKTYAALCAIRDELGLANVSLIHKPAEVALQDLDPVATYDIALTSPPYYNLEIYSDEPTQSVASNDGYQTWLNEFMSPVIAGVIRLGVKYSCWSVKNFKTDKKYDLLDDVTRIHGEHGWRLLDDVVFTMANSRRPGQKAKSHESSESSESSEVAAVAVAAVAVAAAVAAAAPKKTEECTYVFVRATS